MWVIKVKQAEQYVQKYSRLEDDLGVTLSTDVNAHVFSSKEEAEAIINGLHFGGMFELVDLDATEILDNED